MKILTIPAQQDTAHSIEDVEDITLTVLQSKVSGYIEAVRLPAQSLVVYINEEGKLDGLPPNPRATEICRTSGSIQVSDWISGDAVIVRQEGPSDVGLTAGDIAFISAFLTRYE